MEGRASVWADTKEAAGCFGNVLVLDPALQLGARYTEQKSRGYMTKVSTYQALQYLVKYTSI